MPAKKKPTQQLAENTAANILKKYAIDSGMKIYQALISEQDPSKAIVLFSQLITEVNHELKKQTGMGITDLAALTAAIAAVRKLPSITTGAKVMEVPIDPILNVITKVATAAAAAGLVKYTASKLQEFVRHHQATSLSNAYQGPNTAKTFQVKTDDGNHSDTLLKLFLNRPLSANMSTEDFQYLDGALTDGNTLVVRAPSAMMISKIDKEKFARTYNADGADGADEKWNQIITKLEDIKNLMNGLQDHDSKGPMLAALQLAYNQYVKILVNGSQSDLHCMQVTLQDGSESLHATYAKDHIDIEYTNANITLQNALECCRHYHNHQQEEYNAAHGQQTALERVGSVLAWTDIRGKIIENTGFYPGIKSMLANDKSLIDQFQQKHSKPDPMTPNARLVIDSNQPELESKLRQNHTELACYQTCPDQDTRINWLKNRAKNNAATLAQYVITTVETLLTNQQAITALIGVDNLSEQADKLIEQAVALYAKSTGLTSAAWVADKAGYIAQIKDSVIAIMTKRIGKMADRM